MLYSDNLNSKFKQIKHFSKNEKNNPSFSNLIPCIDKGFDRHVYNPVFKAVISCIDSFLEED